MKYLSEYRSSLKVKKIANDINNLVTRSWTIMEVCGGQTHTIVKYQLQDLLSDKIQLIHGPGCPVCVTSERVLDQAVMLSHSPSVILATFGDMLRVPTSQGSLLDAKARGADIRIIYSPLDAIKLAVENQDRVVVLLAVGFETTAAPYALATLQAEEYKLNNFYLLTSLVRVPPALEALEKNNNHRVQGYLAAGHVCTVMGTQEYEKIATTYHVPIVVTGFEPLDILLGIKDLVGLLENSESKVVVNYSRVVKKGGNEKARNAIDFVFTSCDQDWRGLGKISQSGWELNSKYQKFDVFKSQTFFKKINFQEEQIKKLIFNKEADVICQSGLVLTGQIKPDQCPYFGSLCRPENPLGAPMVSSEGACAAYYLYRRKEESLGEFQ